LQRAGAKQLIGAPSQEATVADVGIDCGVGGDIASILKTVRFEPHFTDADATRTETRDRYDPARPRFACVTTHAY